MQAATRAPIVTDAREHLDAPRTERVPAAVVVALFALLAYFPLFLNLDVLPFRTWDEARQAASAYEMYRSGDLLVTHYGGLPDMWSVKPPLLIWLQSLLFHLFGPGELAVRLPAAISALLIGWMLLRFFWKDLQRPWSGLLACGVLLTSHGFINTHVARSGDYDAPLILFMCWSLWSIHRWSENGDHRHVLYFFLALGLAVLTKSIQALLFLPGIFCYLLMRRKLLPLFTLRSTFRGIMLFILLVGSFYGARELFNPGYLEAVWNEELWGRYGTTLSGHRWPWNFYLDQLIAHDISYWYLFVPVGAVIGLVHTDPRIRSWTLLLILVSAGYLLVISTAQTKLAWYTAPLMPLYAGLVAIGIHTSLTLIVAHARNIQDIRHIHLLLPLLFFLVIARPWSAIVNEVYHVDFPPWEREIYSISRYMKRTVSGKIPLDADVIVLNSNHQQLMFYVHLSNDQGRPIQFATVDELLPGQRVLVSEADVHEAVRAAYEHEVIFQQDNLSIYRIDGTSVRTDG